MEGPIFTSAGKNYPRKPVKLGASPPSMRRRAAVLKPNGGNGGRRLGFEHCRRFWVPASSTCSSALDVLPAIADLPL